MPRKLEERLETYLMEVVDGTRTRPRDVLLRLFLGALSYLFTGLVQLRLWMYQQGLLKHHTLGCQVLSVGNLTVGGTGKTPVVEMLARSLEQSGRRVAILSRGYKKKKLKRSLRKKFNDLLHGKVDVELPLVVSDGQGIKTSATYSGDEPYMLAKNLPGVSVIVGKNRILSGQYAIRKLKCDTLILDDGFQHLALKHRLDIVLVDRTNPFDNERTLPRGLLREPIRNIKRAGFIFITKSNGDGAEELSTRLRELNPTAEISECRHRPRYLKHLFGDKTEDLKWLKGKKLIALSGIAVPGGFERELINHGARVLDHIVFVDHHRYSDQEILDVMNEAVELGVDAIVTTEKDAVRIPKQDRKDVPFLYLRVEIEMFTGQEEYHEWVRRICLE